MRRTAIALLAAVVALGLGRLRVGRRRRRLRRHRERHGIRRRPSLSGDITVLAAASLTESFTTLGEQFEAANPGVEVTFSFAASSALATQITAGAPADVFASASATTMDAVVAAGAAADPKTFATNVMEIAVPPANPGKVTGVDDLATPTSRPRCASRRCRAARPPQKVFTNARITVTPVTLEPDVKSVLSKVQLGEVDAGVVYVTDVLAAGDKVKGVEIPDDVNASTSYPIAALTRAPTPPTAAAFVDVRPVPGREQRADRGRLPAAVTRPR